MQFTNDIGRTQKLMTASPAGIAHRKAIMDNLSLNSESRIIDIGCGGGHLLELFAKTLGLSVAVYGLDPSEELIAKARSWCAECETIRLLHSSATEVGIEDASFNMLNSRQTLEYIPNVDAALSECTSIIKGYGGVLEYFNSVGPFPFLWCRRKTKQKNARCVQSTLLS